MEIACQLYTVRDHTQRDFAAAAREVASVGYRAVELAGYGSLRSAAEVRKVFDEHGLVVAGSHAGVDALEKSLDRLIEDSLILGNRTIVLTGFPESRRRDAAGWAASAQALDRIGQACHDRGLELAYHNHNFEFIRFDGRYGLEILWENTDPRFVKAELDVYWARRGGVDPAGYVSRLAGRVTHLHLKDVQPGPEWRFGELGTGILDFPGILGAASRAGVRWGIVEQDTTYDRPSLESVRMSFEYLRRLGAV